MIWAAPDHPIPSVYDADTAEGQEHGVMQLFRLVKALLLLNFDTEQLSLTICTFQAQPIHEHDEVNPSHASIHGLAGSLAKEYTNWSIRLLDLESQRGDRHLPDVSLYRRTPREIRGSFVQVSGTDSNWPSAGLMQMSLHYTGTAGFM